MRILVQKFGGTVLASESRRKAAIRKTKNAVARGFSVVVVVSAMGRSGFAYSTDTLLSLVDAGTPKRELDMLLGCGETISAVVLGGMLRANGLGASVFSGKAAGLKTDSRFGDATIVAVEPSRVLDALTAGLVAVVAGFQAEDAHGNPTTLGRGGSDVTAAALGAALGAERIEIYTDVPGILTADPRVVLGARPIERMSYEESFQLAHEGARVIQPRALRIAMHARLPVLVGWVDDDFAGTLIGDSERHHIYERSNLGAAVSAVTHQTGLVRIELGLKQPLAAHKALSALARGEISMDMIVFSQSRLVFVVCESVSKAAEAALWSAGLRPEVLHGCAKVSVVGAGMRGVPGVMEGVVSALSKAGVTILQTVDSHTTISCLVISEHAEISVNALHARFGLG